MTGCRAAAAVCIGAVLAFATAACGFAPVHGQRAEKQDAAARLTGVEIAQIPDRVGQLMRNDLLNRFAPFGGAGSARYRLEVSLQSNDEGLGFQPDQAITRINFRLGATYRLIELTSGKTVFADVARSMVGYNVVQSDFANLSAQREAQRRAAGVVSERIAERLSLFLSDQDAAPDQ